jgi:hypothetical protein
MRIVFSLILLTFSIQSFGQTLKNCSICSNQIIKNEQLKNLSIDELRFLTNDLFARKGYKFKSSDVDNYYSNFNWYKPVSDNEKIIYNSIEKQNIKLFQDKASYIKKEREKLISELKFFKSALLTNDKSTLSAKYSYFNYNEQCPYLKEAFGKINLDDINWSLNVGMYRITVDNGDCVMNYEIKINPNGFEIKYGNQGGSEISKQLYPNEQMNESTFWWEFEWRNDKMKYLKVNSAG